MRARSIVPWLLATTILALGGGAGTAAMAQDSPYGINVHAPTGPQLERLFDEIEAAGIGWVRIDFVWALVEPIEGIQEWGIYDEIVAAAEARGLEVLAILAYTPQWATDGPELSGVPRNPNDWSDFCFRAAQRYGPRIAAWEVWNEPNLADFWAGTKDQYLDTILAPAITALRAALPQTTIAAPGLAHLRAGGGWYNWLYDVLRRLGSQIDVVSHHAYDDDGADAVTEKLEQSTPFGDTPQLWNLAPPSLREVLEAARWGERPVWLTETGWASDLVGTTQQATHYRSLLEQWLGDDPTRSWIDKLFFYEIQDDPRAGIAKFGILRADFSTKPAYTAYRDFIGTSTAPPPETKLRLHGGDFVVEVAWIDERGSLRDGVASSFSEESGFFTFFDEENVELAVKVLDARLLNDHYWVYYGALSDVEYWISVRHLPSGRRVLFHNPPGNLCGGADTRAFYLPSAGSPRPAQTESITPVPRLPAIPVIPVTAPTLPTPPTRAATALAACAPGALCLQDGRFQVAVEWREPFNGQSGIGEPLSSTDQSGFFWFFEPGNIELVVKLLDGTGVNGHFWVFAGALSDVEYTIDVTDTATGAQRIYRNPAGTLCGLADIEAF